MVEALEVDPAWLPRALESPEVSSVVGLARRLPASPDARAEWHALDVAEADLEPVFRGADVVYPKSWGRIEAFRDEKAALAEDIKDVMGEAKSTGFDVKIMRAPANGGFGAWAYPASLQNTSVKSTPVSIPVGGTACVPTSRNPNAVWKRADTRFGGSMSKTSQTPSDSSCSSIRARNSAVFPWCTPISKRFPSMRSRFWISSTNPKR